MLFLSFKIKHLKDSQVCRGDPVTVNSILGKVETIDEILLRGVAAPIMMGEMYLPCPHGAILRQCDIERQLMLAYRIRPHACVCDCLKALLIIVPQ